MSDPLLQIEGTKRDIHPGGENLTGKGQGPQKEKSSSQVGSGSDGDQALEIVGKARVAISQHAAHRMAAKEDSLALGHPFDGGHAGRQVAQEIAVDVPLVIDVRWQWPPRVGMGLALKSHRALAVAPQLPDVNVYAAEEEVLDELARSPGMAILRKSMQKQQDFAQQRLGKILRRGLVAGDRQFPAVIGHRRVAALFVEGSKFDLVDRR